MRESSEVLMRCQQRVGRVVVEDVLDGADVSEHDAIILRERMRMRMRMKMKIKDYGH